MSNPRIEEVEDDDIDDPGEMDLDAFDFSRPQQGSLQPSMDATSSQMSPEAVQSMLQPQNEQSSNSSKPQLSDAERERILSEQKERSKDYQCIYPVYFDSTRSREQGRRVKKEAAVPNPLAREIVDALHHVSKTLGVSLPIVFEPDKMSPEGLGKPGQGEGVSQEGREAC